MIATLVLSLTFLTSTALFIYFYHFRNDDTSLTIVGLSVISIISLISLLFWEMLHYKLQIPLAIFSVILVIIAIGLILWTLLEDVLFLWNAAIVWHRESHSLANNLTLIIGIIILLYPFFNQWVDDYLPHWLANIIINLEAFVIGYLTFLGILYLLALWMYLKRRPNKDQDFIITLGSGLIDGYKVSPLLGARIKTAIDFYQQQLTTTGKKAQIIFSGGQGGDEKLPEGQAMLDYAHQNGLPNDVGVVEGESKTTYQNMLFSKKIIDVSGIKNPQVLFATNNYHTLRAGMYAKKAGLKTAQGIGSKVSLFFLPNAILREFIAYLKIHKYFNMFMFMLMLIAAIVLGFAAQ